MANAPRADKVVCSTSLHISDHTRGRPDLRFEPSAVAYGGTGSLIVNQFLNRKEIARRFSGSMQEKKAESM